MFVAAKALRARNLGLLFSESVGRCVACRWERRMRIVARWQRRRRWVRRCAHSPDWRTGGSANLAGVQMTLRRRRKNERNNMGQTWWAFVYHLRNWGFFYIAGQIKQSSVVILGSISQCRSRTSGSFPKAHLSASDFLSSVGHLLWHSQQYSTSTGTVSNRRHTPPPHRVDRNHVQ